MALINMFVLVYFFDYLLANLIQLHLVAMDNALNCDTAAISIPAHIPTFRGSSDRLRCFTHCIQLISHVRLYIAIRVRH